MVGGPAVGVGVGRPVERVGHGIGGAGTAEDLQRIQLRIGRDPGPDLEPGEIDLAVVRAGVGAAVGQHAQARCDARDVGAVADTFRVERIRIGDRRVLRRVAGVVVVAHKIGAPDDLRRRERAGLDHLRIVVLMVRGAVASAEVGVVVIDTGIDDPDADAGAGEAAHGPGPCRRCADPGHARFQVRLVPVDALDADDAGQRP